MTRGGVTGSALGTFVVGAILLRTAVAPPVAPPAPTGAPPKASATLAAGTPRVSQKGNQLAEDGPWKASQAHFAGMFPSGGCQPRKQRWCIPDSEPVQAMIAIAPDPAHTHLALVFDRTVEAIQLAAQSANYVVDRYWLPWDIAPKAEWVDYDSLQHASKDQTQKERQPGLLLFRWNGEQEKHAKRQTTRATVLYVFLVADTSTAGINGQQFSNAVDYVREVCAKNGGSTAGCAVSDAIHIMGPTFSGSLASLRRLVEARSPQNFVAYSGTVSSLCAQGSQRLLKNQGLLKEASLLCNPYPDYEPAQHLTFQSFVSSTESAVGQFISLLKADRDIKCNGTPEVAILSEAATTYGQATEQRMSTDSGPRDCYTSFAYPREIASLRNASQVAAKLGPAGASNAGAVSPYLQLNLADQANRSDEPPDFSNLQGPLSKEAVLMNFAAELRRDHYKYIGISGTNILDVLFLTTFLRKAVPDARLFLVNSDLLLERDLDNVPYIGTLAITTYPLVLRHLDWTSPQRRLPRLPFADQYEQGQYNASVRTIREALGYPEDRGVPYGCASPCSQAQLPLWLAVVGTGGYWPVQTLSGPSTSSRKAELSRQDFSGAWTVIAVFLCALGFLHCGVLLRAWPFSATFRDFSLLSAEPGQRLFFIHTASASLVLALSMMGAPAWRSSSQPPVGTIVVIVIAGLLLACVLLEISYLLRWIWDKTNPARASNRKVAVQIAASIAVWTVAAALIYAWRTLFDDRSSDYGFFFSYRAVHLATGVSPLTPMLPLLAAIYLWAVVEVWRLRFNDQVRPRLNPSGAPDDPGLDKLRPGVRREKPIANAVSNYLLNPVYSACFFLIFAVWFLFFDPRHAFDLFERPAFGTFYEFLFCLVVALILSSGFRMAQIWLELKKLLLELDRSLVRFTFTRLKDPGWSSTWRPGSEEVEWGYMVRSLEVIRQLGQGDSESVPSLETGAATLSATVGDIRTTREKLQKNPPFLPAVRTTFEYANLVTSEEKKMAAECRQLQGRICQIQDHLADILGEVLDTLQKSWLNRFPEPKEDGEQEKDRHPVVVYCCQEQNDKAGHRVVAYRYEEESNPEAERQKLLEKYVALRYVAFIRAVLGRIRLLLIFLAISFSLLLISLNAYSFEPHQALIWSITAIFAVIGFISVVVVMQAHRDPILSRITGTQPNHLELAFYLRIFSLGAVPLLTLLSTHFPSIGRSLVSFLQPGLEALK